jgi:hypothetical protein
MSAASRSAVRPLSTRSRRLAAGATVAGLFAAALSLVAIVPGCGGSSSDYYCDEKGCYQCDGFGCATVDPPIPTSCSRAGDAVCTGGEVCTDEGCLVPCTSDAACAKGFICKKGFCAAPTAKDPSKLVCGVAADCGAGYDCIDGACVAIPACSGVGCVCKYSSECGDGRVCANGQCAEACSTSKPCATGFTCDANGICQRSAKPVCGAAAGGALCASGQHCVDGQCAAGCAVDGDCLGADGKPDDQQRCVGGACQPDPHPATNCTPTTACGANQQCLDGFCRYSCASDDDCLKIDTRIGTCAADKVCRSAAEAAAKCTAQADCGAGKSCIDGQCK